MSHSVGNHLYRLVLGAKSQVLFKLADVLKLEQSAFLALVVEVLYFELRVDFLVEDFAPAPIQLIIGLNEKLLNFAVILPLRVTGLNFISDVRCELYA